MASAARLSPSDIVSGEQHLVGDPQRYSLLMLYRGLQNLAEDQGGTVRVRPALTLNLPRGEVEYVERIENDEGQFSAYQINVNLPGLYGASSPLPNFYTEDLIRQDCEERTEARLFLDIFHQQYYRLLLDSLQKHRAAFSLVEEDSDFRKLLWAFVGLRGEEAREKIKSPELFLRYQSLFSRTHRSAQGLETLLSDYFPGVSISIEQCVPRKVTVSKRFQISLGGKSHALGENALLGNTLIDHTSQCRINIGPIGADRFHQLLNEGKEWSLFISLLSHYIKGSILCELVFSIKKQEAQTTRLSGGHWGQLGIDTWLYTQDDAVRESSAERDGNVKVERESVLLARQLIA